MSSKYCQTALGLLFLTWLFGLGFFSAGRALPHRPLPELAVLLVQRALLMAISTESMLEPLEIAQIMVPVAVEINREAATPLAIFRPFMAALRPPRAFCTPPSPEQWASLPKIVRGMHAGHLLAAAGLRAAMEYISNLDLVPQKTWFIAQKKSTALLTTTWHWFSCRATELWHFWCVKGRRHLP
jgi:hypothetical protein